MNSKNKNSVFRDNGRKEPQNSLQVLMCLHKSRRILSVATVVIGLPIQHISIQHTAGTRAVCSTVPRQQSSEVDNLNILRYTSTLFLPAALMIDSCGCIPFSRLVPGINCQQRDPLPSWKTLLLAAYTMNLLDFSIQFPQYMS